MSARAHFLFLLSLAPAAWAQGEKVADSALIAREKQLRAEIRAVQSKLAGAKEGVIRPVKVNGVELSPAQTRRQVMFLMQAGANLVKSKIADFFIEEWKQRAIEEGRKEEEFEISEEKIVDELAGQVREFQLKNPGVEFWEAVRALTGLTREGYMRQRRQTELFNKVFFPGPAKNWPMITREAIMASASGGDGQEFWKNIEKSSVDENGKPRELPAFWMHLCRGWVQKQLEKWSDIRYPSDGLPPDVVLSVNGREWHTDEAFKQVREGVFIQDLERAMLEVVIHEALKQELQKAGAYLDDETFRKAFDEYRQEYDSTPFTTEVIAVSFKGYPSLEAFRQRWRLMRSFEDMIQKEINDDQLKAHAERFARFFSDGQTNVDVIQFMARDVKTGAWLPDGFDRAEKKCIAALEQIRSGKSFDEVLDEQGEYYATDESKGRLGAKSLNQLRQSLRESEFTDLLMGYSLGYYLFYDAEVGKVHGPLRGAEGYFLARVNARTPATGPVDISDERTRELVKQDYVSYRFLLWANEVLSRTVVE